MTDAAPANIPLSVIVDVVAVAYGVRRTDLMSRSRMVAHAWPRQVSWWIIRRVTPLSLAQLAPLVARDPSTISHGVRLVEDRRTVDVEVAGELEQLLAAVRAFDECPAGEVLPEINPIAAAERVAIGGARGAFALHT